jgi:hypothetical protein
MRWKFLSMVGLLLTFAWFKGIKVICFTFYRSSGDQRDEFNAGRSRTLTGKHPVWLAMDLAIVDDNDSDLVVDKEEIRWTVDPRYEILGIFWESIGGIWGGRWRDPKDPYHFEL